MVDVKPVPRQVLHARSCENNPVVLASAITMRDSVTIGSSKQYVGARRSWAELIEIRPVPAARAPECPAVPSRYIASRPSRYICALGATLHPRVCVPAESCGLPLL